MNSNNISVGKITYTARPESEFRNRYAGYWRTSIPKNAIIVWKRTYETELADPEAIKTVKEYFDYHTRALKCVLLKWIQNDKDFIPYRKDKEDYFINEPNEDEFSEEEIKNILKAAEGPFESISFEELCEL